MKVKFVAILITNLEKGKKPKATAHLKVIHPDGYEETRSVTEMVDPNLTLRELGAKMIKKITGNGKIKEKKAELYGKLKELLGDIARVRETIGEASEAVMGRRIEHLTDIPDSFFPAVEKYINEIILKEEK